MPILHLPATDIHYSLLENFFIQKCLAASMPDLSPTHISRILPAQMTNVLIKNYCRDFFNNLLQALTNSLQV